MNEMQKLGAQEAFLRAAGKADPFFGIAERRWHRAKSHVAKGHDEETARLKTKGMRAGLGIGSSVGSVLGASGGWKGLVIGNLVGAGVGAVVGRGVGEWEAGQRLSLSQARGAHGHYAPLHPKLANAAFGGLSAMAPAVNTVLSNTAKTTRAQIRGVGRATKIKPPQDKVLKVKTPAPQPPRVEPTTITPTQAPAPFNATKTATVSASNPLVKKLKKRARDRTTAGEPQTGGKPQRPGEDMTTGSSKPSNDPVTHTNSKPRDF